MLNIHYNIQIYVNLAVKVDGHKEAGTNSVIY